MVQGLKRTLLHHNTFTRYLCTGGINTLIHWSFFMILTDILYVGQIIANISAFCIAVICSYIINARWTFQALLSLKHFGFYIFFMAILAGLTGYTGKNLQFSALQTLIMFSTISLPFGYLYSKFIVFKGKV